ncbi:hypothetical protein [Piscinibacter koreensis]|uniref:PXPV repeat-containing protein n=1 Tax=Piscinibacter koreensis TaxID=2742824 RepID=A0A7Y6TVU6_9BURK|nr:hypothetical protein [Schlegelella koreensis]NUZ05327.1 hypothetical protein [Schlegelella koreensis]
MKKGLFVGLAAAAALLGTGAAHAGGVHWSVGIAVPPVQTIVSNGPVYYPAPGYYAPPPVVYAPAPVYHVPAYRSYYYPAPAVVYSTPYVRHRHDGWRGRDGWRDGGWGRGRHRH